MSLNELLDDGDMVLEDRERGFTVDNKKMFEKLSTKRTTDNQTAYISDLIDFAMQNNAGTVAVTAKPKLFEISVTGAGLTKQQLEAVLALAHQQVIDNRFSKIAGLARGIGANLGNENLRRITIDTRAEGEEGSSYELSNVLENGIMPKEMAPNLKEPGFRIRIERKKPEVRPAQRVYLVKNAMHSLPTFFDRPSWLRR